MLLYLLTKIRLECAAGVILLVSDPSVTPFYSYSMHLSHGFFGHSNNGMVAIVDPKKMVF
jgi:hypothetical protein